MYTIPEHYDCGTVHFFGDPNASYERHLLYDYVVHPKEATRRLRFEAVARAVRDLLAQRWLKTQATYERANPKWVYYLSMEFLIGRALTNNIVDLGIEPLAQAALAREGLDLPSLAEIEPDAGLGNGGLGRLAACFIDSLATLRIPAIGYGLRYEYGMFRQRLDRGCQVEEADHWLRRPDPWEVSRPDERARIHVNASVTTDESGERLAAGRPAVLLGIPYDRPVAATGAGRSTRCGCGAPYPRPSSTSASSAAATSSPPCCARSRCRISRAFSIPTTPPRRPPPALRPGVLPRRLLALGHPRSIPPAR